MKQKDKNSKAFGRGKDLTFNHDKKPLDNELLKPKPSLRKIVYTGLCVNCEKRSYCPFCNQPGGVWYCEEYE